MLLLTVHGFQSNECVSVPLRWGDLRAYPGGGVGRQRLADQKPMSNSTCDRRAFTLNQAIPYDVPFFFCCPHESPIPHKCPLYCPSNFPTPHLSRWDILKKCLHETCIMLLAGNIDIQMAGKILSWTG